MNVSGDGPYGRVRRGGARVSGIRVPALAQAKLNDVQNRLGFVVTLARRPAERREDAATVSTLTAVEGRLQRSRLAREDTLCRESMTRAERVWLRSHRPSDARRWNLLTDVLPEKLRHVS